jgi:hypothetical protein
MANIATTVLLVGVSVTGCARTTPSARVHHLVLTINENPDVFHWDRSPSGDRLVDLGVVAIPPLLDVVLSGDLATRVRAVSVIARVADARFGFVPGRGFPSAASEDQCRRLWTDLGNLSADGSRDERQRAVALWRQWYRTAQKNG